MCGFRKYSNNLNKHGVEIGALILGGYGDLWNPFIIYMRLARTCNRLQRSEL